MAFTNDELNVIRTYKAVTGELPSQQELEQALNNQTSGQNLAESLVSNLGYDANDESNVEDFVTSLYQNLLGRDPQESEADQTGVEYWVGEMTGSESGLTEYSASQVTQFFIQAAAENGEDLTAAEAEESLDLESVDGNYVEDDDNGNGNGEQPEVETDITFNTDQNEAVLDEHTHKANNGATSDYESQTHKIFNLGKSAIDQGSTTISKDYTFDLSDQLGEQGHYEGYFLSPTLDNVVEQQGNELILEVIDRHADANDKQDSLSSVRIEGFSFFLDGEAVEVFSEDMASAETYQELADAAAAELNAMAEDRPELGQIEVSTGNDFERQQTDEETQQTTGKNVVGTQIVLTATDGGELTTGGFSTSPVEGGNIDTAELQTETDTSVREELIRTNLELENVGYGSQGGSVNLSGQSNTKVGVQQFDVTANEGNYDSVWLTSLASNPLKNQTHDALEVINLEGNVGHFLIGEQVGEPGGRESITASADAGINDVREFNASGFAGKIALDASVTSAVIDRDLDQEDFGDNAAADNVTYGYNLGGGDDQLLLTFSQEAIAHEDAVLDINLGGGNNVLTTNFVATDAGLTDNWYNDQSDLKNASVESGSGNDMIKTVGSGDLTIETGAGNDTVYTDNAGSATYELLQEDGTIGNVSSKAQWVLNAENQDLTDLQGSAVSENPTDPTQKAVTFLAGAQLTVSFSGAAKSAGVTEGAAEANVNAFESTVTVPTQDFQGDERNINQAIKDAINDDATLSKLLVATDGPDNTLVVKSKIDGTFAGEDLRIDLASADVANNSSLDAASIVNEYEKVTDSTNSKSAQDILDESVTSISDNFQGLTESADGTEMVLGNDSGNKPVSGADSTETSDNIVDVGSNEDVLVLGTGSDSNETVVFSGTQQGHNTIVNFDDTTADNSTDALDFSAFLTTEINNSGSSESAETAPATGSNDVSAGGGTSFTANDVAEITDFSPSSDEGWGNMSASDLLDAFQDNGNSYGNLGNQTVNTITDQSSDGKHIVMVENHTDEGEYKIFEMTSAQDGSDFTDANLVGVADFGANIEMADALVG